MQDEDKSDVSCNHKKSPAVGLNLGVNICDPAMPISLSLPLVSSDSPSLSSSSSSSSSSSLSPHLQFTSLAPIHSIDAVDHELSPPDSGRSSMGDPLVGGLAPFFSAALSLSPTPNVWATTADVSHSSPGTEASALGMQLPKSPRAGAGGSSSSPISPFSTTNPTWSVYGGGTVPRKASPTFGNLWNSVPATAWTGNRFPRSTSYPGRNNIFGPATNSLTLAPPPALEVTSADEGSAFLYQDQYGMAPNLLDNSLRSADYFFHDMIPQDSDIYAGKSYYGYGLDLGDVGYTGEDFVNGSSLNASNLGIHGVSIPPLAHQDGMGYMHRGIPSPSQRLSPRSPVMSSGGMDTTERYSRKVFVGGLPPDIDEEEINASFRRFGSLVVDWPHKAESKSYFPPKGYAFLLFQEEVSVQKLIEACMSDEDKLYLYVSSPTIKDKAVQIRPWKLSDADFVLDASLPLDPRKTVFVGGVPRPLKAVELALIMDRLYGGVCYAGIDIDPELKYPKGAGRVAFSNQQSYIAAISARFVQLQHGDIDKRVEVKPYVLDDQFCDECHGSNSAGRFAPFFCSNINCLQYYCESCWAAVHSQAGREFHKPLVKEGADRPRAVHFRW